MKRECMDGSLRAGRGVALGVVVVVLLSLPGMFACSNLGMLSQRQGCPVVPVPSGELSEHDGIRAQVQFNFDDLNNMEGTEIGFELVARPQPNGLVVVGLAPDGSRLFSVHQRGAEFEIDAHSSKKLRYLALSTMDALHRAFWIEPVYDTSAGSTASRFSWGGEQVLEVRRDGRRQRIFVRGGGDLADPGVTIDYAGESGSANAGRAEIRNVWCGYKAVVSPIHE